MPRSQRSSPDRRPLSPYSKPVVKDSLMPLSHDEFTRLIDQRLVEHLLKIRCSHEEQRAQNKKYASTLVPRMDLQEYTSEPCPHVEAIIELPGLQKEEVFIRVEDGNLVVHGQRKRRFPRASSAVPQQNSSDLASIISGSSTQPAASVKEIKYGRFHRDIPLPRGTLPSHIKAFLNEGLLFLTWPLAHTTGTASNSKVVPASNHTGAAVEVTHPSAVKPQNEDCDMDPAPSLHLNRYIAPAAQPE